MRDVEARFRKRQQGRTLLGLKQLDRHLTRRAVDAGACDVAAPTLGVSSAMRKPKEALARKPAASDVLHLVFDAGLVARLSYARRVDEEARVLRVLGEHPLNLRRGVIRGNNDRLGIVGQHTADDASKEVPRRIESLDDRGRRLLERGPDEHVATERQRDQQHPELTTTTCVGIVDQAHQGEVDLRLLSGRGVVEPDGGQRLLSSRARRSRNGGASDRSLRPRVFSKARALSSGGTRLRIATFVADRGVARAPSAAWSAVARGELARGGRPLGRLIRSRPLAPLRRSGVPSCGRVPFLVRFVVVTAPTRDVELLLVFRSWSTPAN